MVDVMVKERPILFSGPMVRPILNMKLGVWPPEAIDPSKPIKWNTRRVMREQPHKESKYAFMGWPGKGKENQFGAYFLLPKDMWLDKDHKSHQHFKCPYGRPGDRLWVRETHYRYGKWLKNGKTATGRQKWRFKPLTEELHYFDDPPDGVKGTSYRKEAWYKRPSIFLPRWASRINLEIVSIRVERVQDIGSLDAIAEGAQFTDFGANQWGHQKPGWRCDKKPETPEESLSSPKTAFWNLWDSINAKRGYGWAENPWVWVVEFKRLEVPHGG